jgi:hypothetical protein
MGKLKKEIWINGKTYSTNKARKFLSDKLKQNNTMKCTFNGIFKFLSKRENAEFIYIIGSEVYKINVIILPYKENKNRTNKHGENIYFKRNNIKNKIAEYKSIVNEIFNNEDIRNQMKKSLVEKIEKAKETSELFNREVSIFNKNGEFTIKDIDFNYRFEFVTGNVKVYIAFSNLQSNSLKYINQKLEDLKKIKENLEI